MEKKKLPVKISTFYIHFSITIINGMIPPSNIINKQLIKIITEFNNCIYKFTNRISDGNVIFNLTKSIIIIYNIVK